jgi:hypothetical protein
VDRADAARHRRSRVSERGQLRQEAAEVVKGRAHEGSMAAREEGGQLLEVAPIRDDRAARQMAFEGEMVAEALYQGGVGRGEILRACHGGRPLVPTTEGWFKRPAQDGRSPYDSFSWSWTCS